MGNSSSNVNVVPTFDYRSTIHPQLLQSKLLTVDNQVLLEKLEQIHFDEEYQNWKKQKDNNLIKIDYRYLYLPLAIDNQQQSFCSGLVTTKIYYQFYPFRLDKQIELRSRLKKDFQEVELWYLLLTGLISLTQFQKLNIKLGNIDPINILLNQKGKIKYINRYSWPSQQKMINNKQVLHYVAPEQLLHFVYNRNKAECFSLGIILLQCILLKNLKIFYGIKFNEILFFNHLIQLKRSKHQTSLIKILLLMLELQEKNRPPPSFILNLLKPFQDDILALKPILINF